MNWYLSPRLTLSLVCVCGALLVAAADAASGQSIEPDDAPSDATVAAAVAVRPHTIAVLPFSNISGAANDEWLGTGLAETVTVVLELIDAFSVVDHSTFSDVRW